MSKYLAFIAALPLAVMPLPMVFMIISAIHDPGSVAEYGEVSAIVRQETTAPDVSTSDAALNRVHEIQFNTDRPKQLRKGSNGRRDADRRRRNHRRNLEDPSERKRIVVPAGINDAYAGQYEVKPGSILTISRKGDLSDVSDDAERLPAVIWS